LVFVEFVVGGAEGAVVVEAFKAIVHSFAAGNACAVDEEVAWFAEIAGGFV